MRGNSATVSGNEIDSHENRFPVIRYSDIAGCGGSGGGWDNTLGTDGGGNIDMDPLFVNPVNDDYHLKSRAGRWDAAAKSWVMDAVTSPCIDAGDPASDWTEELWPQGKRINMGAFGGTPQASMSPDPIGNIADLNHDDEVDLADWSLWAEDWLIEQTLLDDDLDRDNNLDINDHVFSSVNGAGLHPEYMIHPGNSPCHYRMTGPTRPGLSALHAKQVLLAPDK